MVGLRTRLAPTPSGFLHEGNAFSFMLTWVMARANQGKVVLRIDDLDAQRKRPEYLEDIFHTLEWLGIDWDEGPTGPDDFEQNWSQLKRLDLYHAQIQQLCGKPELIHACTLSRAALAPYEGMAHPAHLRDYVRPLDTPDAALRITVPEGHEEHFLDTDGTEHAVNLSAAMGDFVIRRRDGVPAYQIASLADDLNMEINFIVRGKDLVPSTAAQRFLAHKLDMQNFLSCSFMHHPLVLDNNGSKLSKSAGAASIREMRHQISPQLIYKRLADYLGIPPDTTVSPSDFVQYLSQSHLNHSQ